MMHKFPRNSYEIHGCLTGVLGNSSILIVWRQFFLGLCGTFSDLAGDQNASCASFLVIHGIFEDVDKKFEFLGNSSMFDRFPRKFQYLDCVVPVSKNLRYLQ